MLIILCRSHRFEAKHKRFDKKTTTITFFLIKTRLLDEKCQPFFLLNGIFVTNRVRGKERANYVGEKADMKRYLISLPRSLAPVAVIV